MRHGGLTGKVKEKQQYTITDLLVCIIVSCISINEPNCDKTDINRAVHQQKMARTLKFRLKVEEGSAFVFAT